MTDKKHLDILKVGRRMKRGKKISLKSYITSNKLHLSSLIKAILYASITYLWIVSKTKIESRTKSIQFYLSIFINIMKKLHGQRDEHIVKKITKTLNRFFDCSSLSYARNVFFFSSRMRTPERERKWVKKNCRLKLTKIDWIEWNEMKWLKKANEKQWISSKNELKKNGFILTFSSTNIRTELRQGYWLKKGNRCWYKLFHWKIVL